MLRTVLSSARIAVRPPIVVQTVSLRYYSSADNQGKKGPLTGGSGKTSKSKSKSEETKPKAKSPSKKKAKAEDTTTPSSKTQESPHVEADSSLGAEEAASPESAPGQGVENKGGHAVPEGPGEGGKFAEQGESALKVAGAVESAGTSEAEDRGDKVDPKFWSDKNKSD